MSDRPIQVGDLVMVVRPTTCCGNWAAAGDIFKVLALDFGPSGCRWCPRVSHNHFAIMSWSGPNDRPTSIELSRLKRLDPDALKDDVPTHRELTV